MQTPTSNINEILEKRLDEKLAKMKWRSDNDRECFKKYIMQNPKHYHFFQDKHILSEEELAEWKKLHPEPKSKKRVFADLAVLEKEVDDFLNSFDWSTELFKQSAKKDIIETLGFSYKFKHGDCSGEPKPSTCKFVRESFRGDILRLVAFDKDFAASGKDWDSFRIDYCDSFIGGPKSTLAILKEPRYLESWNRNEIDWRRNAMHVANEKFWLDTFKNEGLSQIHINLVNKEGIACEMPDLNSIVGWSTRIMKYDGVTNFDGDGAWCAVLEPPPKVEVKKEIKKSSKSLLGKIVQKLKSRCMKS